MTWRRPADGASDEADEADERATRPRFFADVIDAVRSAAADQGLLVVLDDLHWAGVPSLRLLAELAPRLRDSSVLVVGLYRGADTEGQPETGRLMTAISRGPRSPEAVPVPQPTRVPN